MYGRYDIPLSIEHEDLTLSIQKEGANLLYTRESLDEKVEKILLAPTPTIFISPVEPLNKPKELTHCLLLALSKSLVVGPDTSKQVFTTFPVEIGVFVSKNEEYECIDILTLTKPKFTLYGEPRTGVICRYWSSEVYSSVPPLNHITEGVMELTITNTTSTWVTVTKAVFNAYGMKIFYDDSMVSMKATMEISSGENAETKFIESPLRGGMLNSLELYTARKLSITTTKYLMEMGL